MFSSRIKEHWGYLQLRYPTKALQDHLSKGVHKN
jgi:hypothetical protein